jgi:hypothetical protein
MQTAHLPMCDAARAGSLQKRFWARLRKLAHLCADELPDISGQQCVGARIDPSDELSGALDRLLHITRPSPRLGNFNGFMDLNATFANCD